MSVGGARAPSRPVSASPLHPAREIEKIAERPEVLDAGEPQLPTTSLSRLRPLFPRVMVFR
jgi:hypothetical protein